MKTLKSSNSVVLLIVLASLVSSCLKEEDPGPLQSDERDYPIMDFDRIEMGDAFVITVQQSSIYSVHISGDRRNLDDLGVVKVGSTLKVFYNDNRNHNHTTYVEVTMPNLVGANLTGATNSAISGFKGADHIELILSGASISQLNVEAKSATFNLSGASKLTASGSSDNLIARASGASELYSYGFAAGASDADASGASLINVYALQSLKATASGASRITYRGNPLLSVSVSGASSVGPD